MKVAEKFPSKTILKLNKTQSNSDNHCNFNSWIQKWFPSWEPQQKTILLSSCNIENNNFNETIQRSCKTLKSEKKGFSHPRSQKLASISKTNGTTGPRATEEMVYDIYVISTRIFLNSIN